LTTQTAPFTAFQSGDGAPPEKLQKRHYGRKNSWMSKSKYTESNISKFELTSESPTKTDKSFIVNSNAFPSKNDLKGIHEVLEKIDQIEEKHKKSQLRHHRGNKRLLQMTENDVDRMKLSIHDRSHPMNLSVISIENQTFLAKSSFHESASR
jgi:hypothetical protein